MKNIYVVLSLLVLGVLSLSVFAGGGVAVSGVELDVTEQGLITAIAGFFYSKLGVWSLAIAAAYPHVRAIILPRFTNKYLAFFVEVFAANYGNAKNES